jgi:hypothetical protein
MTELDAIEGEHTEEDGRGPRLLRRGLVRRLAVIPALLRRVTHRRIFQDKEMLPNNTKRRSPHFSAHFRRTRKGFESP